MVALPGLVSAFLMASVQQIRGLASSLVLGLVKTPQLILSNKMLLNSDQAAVDACCNTAS